MNITTPCHGTPIRVSLGEAGHGYTSYVVVDAFYCDALECYNTWDKNGFADSFNKTPVRSYSCTTQKRAQGK